MATPSMTLNQTAITNQASIAASGTANSGANAVDLRTKFEGHFQVAVTFGTVAAVSGLLVEAFRAVDAPEASVFDTLPVVGVVISSTASTTKRIGFVLPTGLWQVKVTNLDATNAVTNVSVLYALVSAVA